LLAVLNSAISNAENNQGLDIDKLYVSEVKVGKAFTLKRFSARGRGRSSKIIKPYSRLTIYVTEREE
jgi:large subunit ribosomal protein L22